MTSCFNRQGVDLVRAEYIPDDKDDIVQTVLRLKEHVGPDGVIFSSGGIGPTHDDVTYEALASAFGVPCQDAFFQAQNAITPHKIHLQDGVCTTHVLLGDTSQFEHALNYLSLLPKPAHRGFSISHTVITHKNGQFVDCSFAIHCSKTC